MQDAVRGSRKTTDFQDMAEDLGLLAEGVPFMQQDPQWFPLEITLALWKRVKVLEEKVQVRG